MDLGATVRILFFLGRSLPRNTRLWDNGHQHQHKYMNVLNLIRPSSGIHMNVSYTSPVARSLTFCMVLAVPVSRTYAHAHTHPRTHTNAHTYTHTHTHTRRTHTTALAVCSLSLTHTCTHTHTPTHTHTHTHTHINVHINTQKQHILSLSLSLTYTHSRMLSIVPTFSPNDPYARSLLHMCARALSL